MAPEGSSNPLRRQRNDDEEETNAQPESGEGEPATADIPLVRPNRKRAKRGKGARKTLEEMSPSEIEEEHMSDVSWRPVLDRADKLIAFSFIRHFNNGEFEDNLKELLGVTEYDPADEAHKILRAWIMATYRHLQHRTLKNCDSHVKAIRTLDEDPSEGTGELAKRESDEGKHRFYHQNFSSDNFNKVFFFIVNYIDLSKSTKFALFYAKEIYANLCLRIHLWQDWARMATRTAVKNSRDDLLLFIKGLSSAPVLRQIQRGHFYETLGRLRRQRAPKARPDVLPVLGDRYFILAEPPSTELLPPRDATTEDVL